MYRTLYVDLDGPDLKPKWKKGEKVIQEDVLKT